jgi:hypothetical protein
MAPIRPVVSSIYAPAHKAAKYTHQKLNNLLGLKYKYNIINMAQFTENKSKLQAQAINPGY